MTHDAKVLESILWSFLMRIRPLRVMWPVLSCVAIGCDGGPTPSSDTKPVTPAAATTSADPKKKGAAPKAKLTFEKRLQTGGAADSSGPPSEN
jgi:hypothetical protein